tara:strand:- start:2219 stop:2452 length:234 start_codon:yes stop_codon:yes gene_type:complete
MGNILFIGDLVVVKKQLQSITGIYEIGIIIGETKIIPSDLSDIEMDEIDSFNVYFPGLESLYTIPKTCVEKLIILQE